MQKISVGSRVSGSGLGNLWGTAESAGVSVEVAGLPGIFSHDGLDNGTRMLLETLEEQPVQADRLLDFACGAGVIGAWIQLGRLAVKRLWPVSTA